MSRYLRRRKPNRKIEYGGIISQDATYATRVFDPVEAIKEVGVLDFNITKQGIWVVLKNGMRGWYENMDMLPQMTEATWTYPPDSRSQLSPEKYQQLTDYLIGLDLQKEQGNE